MAKQIDRMNVIVTYVRQEDGSYLTSIAGVEGVVSDPLGTNEYEKGPHNVGQDGATPVPTWDAAQTCGVMRTACTNAVKAWAGIP